MSKKYQGIFLFEEWLDGLNRLPGDDAMAVINNIYHFIADDVEPSPLTGNADFIQSVMLAHERRSKQASMYGYMGVEAKRKRLEKAEKAAAAQAAVQAVAQAAVPAPTPAPTPASRAAEREAFLARLAASPPDEPTEEDLEWDIRRVELLKQIRAKREAAEHCSTSFTP